MASRPGLVIGMEVCCFLGSLEELGCLAQGSEGSYPRALVAILKAFD